MIDTKFNKFQLVYISAKSCFINVSSIQDNLWNKIVYTMYKKPIWEFFIIRYRFTCTINYVRLGIGKMSLYYQYQTTKFRFRLFPGDKIFSQDYSLMYITKILFFSFYQIYLKLYTKVYFRNAEWNSSN